MICNGPLHLVTDGTDGQVCNSVDQAHTCPAASRGALRAYVDQSLRGDRAACEQPCFDDLAYLQMMLAGDFTFTLNSRLVRCRTQQR
jgi:hypothetical protein